MGCDARPIRFTQGGRVLAIESSQRSWEAVAVATDAPFEDAHAGSLLHHLEVRVGRQHLMQEGRAGPRKTQQEHRIPDAVVEIQCRPTIDPPGRQALPPALYVAEDSATRRLGVAIETGVQPIALLEVPERSLVFTKVLAGSAQLEVEPPRVL